MRLSSLRVAVAAVAASLWVAPLPAQAPPAASRPNVVLIITDDVGYGDIGSYGAKDIKTPNIDSLARDGVRLTDFYANGPLCSPTRAGLVTGRYQQRFAIEAALGERSTAARAGTARDRPLAAAAAEEHRLRHGAVGKWHLGYKPEFSPNAHGFDYFFGFKSGYIDYYQHTDGDGRPDLFENDKPVADAGYMTDLITDKTTRFIEQNAARPFFLEVAYNAGALAVPGRPTSRRWRPATRRHVMPHEDGTSTRADYVAMMERADQGVGRILRTLDRLGSRGNTIVIFTNDNGGEWLSRNAPLFHRKWTLWEGGIRVPALVRWPGRIPAGQVSPQVGITMDLTASILAADRRDGAGRGAARRHQPLPDPRRTCAGGRAHAVLADQRRRPQPEGRAERRLEADGRRQPRPGLQRAQGRRRAERRGQRTARHRPPAAVAVDGLGGRRQRRGPGQRHVSDQSRPRCRAPGRRPAARWPGPSGPRHGSRIGDTP